MDCIVQGAAKSRTRLSDFHLNSTVCFLRIRRLSYITTVLAINLRKFEINTKLFLPSLPHIFQLVSRPITIVSCIFSTSVHIQFRIAACFLLFFFLFNLFLFRNSSSIFIFYDTDNEEYKPIIKKQNVPHWVCLMFPYAWTAVMRYRSECYVSMRGPGTVVPASLRQEMFIFSPRMTLIFTTQ